MENFMNPSRAFVNSPAPVFWGRWCGFDLQGCDLEILTSAEAIERYIEDLCQMLGFKRYGPPTIVRFGERPEIAGYSFTQLIETSLISGHLVESTRCAFIDIFSCASYSRSMAEEFTRRHFRAAQSLSHIVDRYAGVQSDALPYP
jgi:hypothetical protein